jgi:hypothetical protein
MEIVIVGLELLRRLLSKVGPYLAVEIMLPGGTLLALVLYLYRRRAGLKDSPGRMSTWRPVKRP